MSTPPYMRLYIADYLADTYFLTCGEHGAYLLLLGAMWEGGGKLPNDDAVLARIARCTRPEWAKIKPLMLGFFRVGKRSIKLAKRYLRHIEQCPPRRPYNPAWSGLRAAVLERDGYVCVYCASADGPFEADHVKPLARGGKDALNNLVCACRTCNRSKGAKLVTEWLTV